MTPTVAVTSQLVADTIAKITPRDRSMAERAQIVLDNKTKPRGSLGRLEQLAVQLCAAQRTLTPSWGKKAIVVMAADHGVAAEGVSAYPQEVTAQMLANFSAGGAAINVLARQAGAEVVVVDMGVAGDVSAPGIRQHKVAFGTHNLRHGPAMTRQQAEAALVCGIELAVELCHDGADVVALGDMGIANTTSSSALAAAFTGVDPAELTGSGTGIDDASRRHKVAVIRDGLASNAIDSADPIGVLAAVGGFEIAGLAGTALGAAACGKLVVLDGFISSVAGLVAARLAPNVSDYFVAAHQSIEPGHQVVLRELRTQPLLNLGMRLGEGSGAVLALGLIEAAHAILVEMASFESAGVTDTGA